MKRSKRMIYILCLISALVASGGLAEKVQAEFSCTTGAKEPPFLAPGVPPNLLLMLDNSASMLDMAFIAEGGECYDGTSTNTVGATVDSYATGTSYAGYFAESTWYEYVSSQFVAIDAPSACTGTGAYYNDSLTDADTAPDDICVTISGDAVNFKARGNFLNWATASKFDIQKKVLTGGKYDAANQRLVMEHRGCNEKRFIKQVLLQDQDGKTNFMSLGIHPNKTSKTPFSGVDPNTTVIDIFQINESGFDYQDCQDAIDEMADPNTSLGTLKGDIDACMEYAPNQSYTEPQNPAFNQAVQTCWWWEERTDGSEDLIWDHNHATSLMNHCESMYETMSGSVAPDDPGYVCAGVYDESYGTSFNRYNQPAYSENAGYVGRCWVPEQVSGGTSDSFVGCISEGVTYSLPSGYSASNGYRCQVPAGSTETTQVVHECSGNYNANQGTCNKPWLPIIESGGTAVVTPGHWVDNGNDCVIQALIDFCGTMDIVELVDPYDATQATGAVWNLPAMIIDVGISGQLGDPLYQMIGHIQQTAAPTGLLHTYADRIRFGAMAFNTDGSAYECTTTGINPYITYSCESENVQDGAHVVADIGAGNIDALVSGINATDADTWTPLAEAFLTAIGYYTQDSAMQLQASDFTISEATQPCTNWCQSNNILIITEGASTADLHEAIRPFTDADTADDSAGCGILNGSSYLDDLATYAKTGALTFTYQDANNPEKLFENITTFIVRTGTPRDIGTGECAPDTLLMNTAQNGGLGDTPAERLANSYLDAANPANLYGRLDKVFSDLAARAASGSAASVISSSSSGEGAIYQAIFWPKTEASETLGTDAAYWTGEVHSLFIDSYGHMREDRGGSGNLGNATLDSDGECLADDTDPCVAMFFDSSEGQNKTRACYGGNLTRNNDGTFSCSGTIKELDEINYLWSAAEWLGRISDTNITANRTTYISATPQRYIRTWNDLNRDGAVSTDEVMNFTAGSTWTGLGLTGSFAPAAVDFGIQTAGRDAADVNADVDAVINWVRGREDVALRNRTVPTPASFSDISTSTMPWRLGDVVNSTPTLVTRPADAYHLLYKDTRYRDFYNTYSHRRQVVYFGGNDGMLHAVNAGFYDPDGRAFKKSYTASTNSYGDSGPDLGAELWAYVPYNLLPHLKCLTESNYLHKYYVDMKPRIFDVRIWQDGDSVHVGGWGTILVVGMRFGGAAVSAAELDMLDGVANYPDDNRVFKSAYIVFDITDPEAPPTLLGEMTFDSSSPQFGFTTGAPTVVPMKNGETDYDWYLVLGSGPTDVSGATESADTPKVAVFPLKNLVTTGLNAFRIPNAAPGQTSPGYYTLSDSANGFVSDMITVDYDIEVNYKADVVYFGTIEGGYCIDADTTDATACDTREWGGRLYRLVTGEASPASWETKLMIDVQRPIMAAPTVGYDDRGNYWVYFGTGRFYDILDKSDASSNGVENNDKFYGLKEYFDPAEATSTNKSGFIWPEITDITSTIAAGSTADPGDRNLLRTDQIVVTEALYPTNATLSCLSGECLPSDVATFDQLVDYIVGDTTTTTTGGTTTTVYSGTDGWVLELVDERERNLGQGTLLGGLITFTTYQPFEDLCESEGYTYLYGLYYQTGTGWYQDVFFNNEATGGVSGESPAAQVITRLSLGKGMSTTPNLHVGAQKGSTAFVQTSTGAIIEIEQPNLPLKNVKTGRMSWRSE